MKSGSLFRCRLIERPNLHRAKECILANFRTRSMNTKEQLIGVNGGYTALVALDW